MPCYCLFRFRESILTTTDTVTRHVGRFQTASCITLGTRNRRNNVHAGRTRRTLCSLLAQFVGKQHFILIYLIRHGNGTKPSREAVKPYSMPNSARSQQSVCNHAARQTLLPADVLLGSRTFILPQQFLSVVLQSYKIRINIDTMTALRYSQHNIELIIDQTAACEYS